MYSVPLPLTLKVRPFGKIHLLGEYLKVMWFWLLFKIGSLFLHHAQQAQP